VCRSRSCPVQVPEGNRGLGDKGRAGPTRVGMSSPQSVAAQTGWLDSSAMDNSQSSSSTLDTLRTVEFRLGLKGYNVDEVDEYLDKAAQEAEALQEHVRQLNERLRQASDRIAQLETERRSEPADTQAVPAVVAPEPAPAPDPVEAGLNDETLQRTLLLAQKFVDQTKRESEAEAAAIIAQAEQRASELQTEAEQNLRNDVARLEASRTQLAADVESMARHLESERNRLRAALSDILKWVDENVQPANSLMGVRPKSNPGGGGDGSPAGGSSGGSGAGTPTSSVSPETGGGAPTLNLQNATGSGNPGGNQPF
jgi:DivIVA domain-containing protein